MVLTVSQFGWWLRGYWVGPSLHRDITRWKYMVQGWGPRHTAVRRGAYASTGWGHFGDDQGECQMLTGGLCVGCWAPLSTVIDF